MAGTVANLVYSSTNFIDTRQATTSQTSAPAGGYTTNGLRTMDEDDVLEYLHDESFTKRAEILEYLRTTSRNNGGVLPFRNPVRIFQGLSMVLDDSNWDNRLQCIILISSLIKNCSDVETCMSIVLPKIIYHFGDNKPAIKRAVVQTVHVYMKAVHNVQPIFNAMIQFGLDSNNYFVKKGTIVNLPMLLTPEFAKEDYSNIVLSLSKKLLESSPSPEENLRQSVLLSMNKIRELVGEETFTEYLQGLSAPLRKFYHRIVGSDAENEQAKPSNPMGYQFGVVPSHIIQNLRDHSDYRSRTRAVEELKGILQNLTDSNALVPYTREFVYFLSELLDDNNFRITTVTLEIMGVLVQKLQLDIKPVLEQLIHALSKRMEDNKKAVHLALTSVVIQLMHVLSSKPVLKVLCENLRHRHSRVRQETLNLVIAALLTFPSCDFDLAWLCKAIAPTLVDQKRLVRQASLECYALLAQAMGFSKLQPLTQAVDSIEIDNNGNYDGVLAAVQARLSRKQLPRLDADGLVEYALPKPSSANKSGANSGPQNLDMEWICQAAGGAGTSARSTRSEALELESVTSSARSTPSHLMFENGGTSSVRSTPRRHPSAGKGRSRLPWDEDASSIHNGHNAQQTTSTYVVKADAHSTMRNHATWGPEDMTPHIQNNKKVTRRQTFSTTSEVSNQERKKFQQRYLDRYRRQFSEGHTPSSGVPTSTKPNSNIEEEPSSPPPEQNSPPGYTPSLGYPGSPGQPRKIQHSMSFSSSWPDPRMFEDALRPNTHVLDPILGGEATPNRQSPDTALIEDEEPNTQSPTGAGTSRTTLPRVVSSRRKVPPIHHQEQPEEGIVVPVQDSQDMHTSLYQIRNSASKKKAQKIFEKLEQNKSPSPSRQDEEDSAYWSNVSTGHNTPHSHTHSNAQSNAQSNVTATNGLNKKGRKPGEAPFEGKARLARKPSINGTTTKAPEVAEHKTSVLRSDSKARLDFNPMGGVTFRENHNPDVQIIGRGYGDDIGPETVHKPQILPNKPPKKMPNRTAAGGGQGYTTLGVQSTHNFGTYELKRKSNAVFGKGVFDVPGSAPDSTNQADPSTRSLKQGSSSDLGNKKFTSRVVGVKVRNNSVDKSSPEDYSDDEEEELAMSMNTKRKIQQRRAEQDQRHLEREQERRRRQEIERQEQISREKQQKEKVMKEKVTKEKQMQKEKQMLKEKQLQKEKEKLKLLSVEAANNDAQQRDNNSTTRPGAKPPRKPVSKTKSPSTLSDTLSSAGSERDAHAEHYADELKPIQGDPNGALNQVLRNISNKDWNVKCNNLVLLQRLVTYHGEVLCPQLHAICTAVIEEVKNLRSQVSRLAIVVLGEMYAYLKKHMDAELDQTVKVLLCRHSDSNAFIKSDVDTALKSMVDNVTQQRALTALIVGGASHKNPAIRKSASFFIAQIVEKMGPGRALSGVRDCTDRIVPVAAQFILDGSGDTRYNGQCIMHMLMSHEDFDKMLKKYLAPNTLRSVQDKIDTLKKKGLGEPPSGTASAGSRRSGQGMRSNAMPSRNNSAFSSSAGSEVSSVSSAPSSSKRRLRVDEATKEELDTMMKQMSSKDWRERNKALEQFQQMIYENSTAVAANIVKIFDKFIPCLRDSNPKVNLFALQVMRELIPELKDYLSAVVNLSVETVASKLSSNNTEIYNAASIVLDDMMTHLDKSSLLQPFANQAQKGNARIKPDMIERVSYLSQEVYPRKSKQVLMHVLPLTWNLLALQTQNGGGGNAAIKTKTRDLVLLLYGLMGDALLDEAAKNSKVTPQMSVLLNGILNL